MKNKIFTLSLILSLGCLLISCSKDSPSEREAIEPIQSVYSLAPEIELYTQIKSSNEEFSDLTSFLGSLEMSDIESENTDLTKVQFKDYPELTGVQISLFSDNSFTQRDLLSIYDSKSKTRFTLIREIEGFCNNETGSITFRSPDDKFILSTHYKDGINISEYNSMQKTADKAMNCTYDEFGEFYFAAKEECESDWLCDLACSFNPCSIAYLASAVIECAKN